MIAKSRQDKAVLSVLEQENAKIKAQIKKVTSSETSQSAKLKTENFQIGADVEALENQLLMLNEENSKLEILLGEQTTYNSNLKKRNDGFEDKIEKLMELIAVEKSKKLRVQREIQDEELRAIKVVSDLLEDQNLDKNLKTKVGSKEITSNVRSLKWNLIMIDLNLAQQNTRQHSDQTRPRKPDQ